MLFPRKLSAIEWIIGSGVLIVGMLFLGLWLHQRAFGTTPEDELTPAEGIPEEITVTSLKGESFLEFTVGGFRTGCSSDSPNYEEVLTAVRSGKVVQAWISTKQET